jgi:uncharacterized protein with PIN domain
MPEVTLRVYGPLNDFLPAHRRRTPWRLDVDGRASVKDVVERAGVPHPEIDLILVNGASVGFDAIVRSGDRIAVFPPFVAFDVRHETRVRPAPLEPLRFLADVHLGTLARRLRLAGLDAAYEPAADDAALADLAARQRRILLTRDVGLLMRRAVTHGYFVRETNPQRQLVEVLRRFGPLDLRPFSRCLRCNGLLHDVPESTVASAVPPRTRQHYHRYERCDGCGGVYWKGSHWRRLKQTIDEARAEAEGIATATH